jgi:hypothetical protein
MYKLVICFMFGSGALGQDLSRSFKLQHNDPQGMQEIATTLRSVFDIQKLAVDGTTMTIAISGNADQIALAEWLIPKLDLGIPSQQKYFYAGNTNDVIDVYPLKNATRSQDLQEILTTLRTVADIQKIYQTTASKLLIFRSDPNHIAAADFLITQLDQVPSPRTSPILHTFHMTLSAGGREQSDTLIVYGLANTQENRDLQEILTDLRTVLTIQKIYQYSSTKFLAIRADANRIQMAEWLIPKLDATTPAPSGNEIQFPGGNDDFVKVFYLPKGTELQPLITNVRSTIGIRTVYQQTSLPALIIRAKADQLTAAARLLPTN